MPTSEIVRRRVDADTARMGRQSPRREAEAATADDPNWRRQLPTGALRNDVLLAVLLAATSVPSAQVVFSLYGKGDLGWRGIEAYLWGIGICLALAGRRRFPIATMLVTLAAFYGVGERLAIISASLTIQLAIFIAIYSAWAWSGMRRVLWWATAVAFTGMAVWVGALLFEAADAQAGPRLGWFGPTVATAIHTITVNLLYFFGSMFWGLAAWRKARARDRVERQAAQLRRDRDIEAQRAVTAERLRIARDLHDVVAHHVSSIGVQAAGARRLLNRQPERSAEALQTIESSSREAVAEMQQIVAMLRFDDETSLSTRDPQPGLSELDVMVAQAVADGQRVSLRRSGEAIPVSASVELSLYRIVQESLSNARKYAPDSEVDVVVRYLSAGQVPEVEVETVDAGAASGRDIPEPSDGGWGLVGIRERAAMHGGTTDIGPRPGRGFRVRVRLPAGVGT